MVSNGCLASHSLRNIHWKHPTQVAIGNSMTEEWQSILNASAADWNVSNVLDITMIHPGSNPAGNASVCSPYDNMIEICNGNYSDNGWMGRAQSWVNYEGHIHATVVQLNDYYFQSKNYNTNWKSYVLCHEIGHALGLAHADESFTNEPLGSCMDYSMIPNGNEKPNEHDYEQLSHIYRHNHETAPVYPSPPAPPVPGRRDVPNNKLHGSHNKGQGLKKGHTNPNNKSKNNSMDISLVVVTHTFPPPIQRT